ncbi:probable oxidoreductase PXDNL [Bacillus rossius redtenbacheri]|uniref:probable oxidoreductase PXDNL n=1 Tax=Bacillus rossius redtenbacheri TaxID=93214 RepID=UPI002FDCE263
MGRVLMSSAVAAVLLLSALGSAPVYNVTEYVSSAVADADLRGRAAVALDAERRAQDPDNRWGPCPPSRQGGPCPPGRYRTHDGACNNVRHPRWGARGEPFRRLLPPSYADGTSEPRRAPPADEAWAALSPAWPPLARHGFVTGLAGAWGELLRRDMALPAAPENLQCCHIEHPECASLKEEGGCVPYQRSLPSTDKHCSFDQRQQMNTASAFLDGSALYGGSEADIFSLRTGDGGQVNLDACVTCRERTGLGALFSVLLREHNRLALQLSALNPGWDDDTLFREARKLLVAQLQLLTYKEFLPTVLGDEAVHRLGLEPKAQGFYNGYSSSYNAGVFNSVATAAMRLFSTMIPDSLRELGASHNRSHAELIDSLLREPAMEPSLGSLRPGGGRAGPVLIQAGRDHGLPGYTEWFQHCAASLGHGAGNLTAWSLRRELLQRAYSRPEEVDLVVGASLEGPAPGAVLGPTLSCLLGRQFALARDGDRFWFENDIPPSSFTPAQLQEVRKVTVAGLLCLNTPGLATVQSRAFVQEDPFLNVRIPCELQPAPELRAWRDDTAAGVSNEMVAEAVERAGEALKRRRQKEYELWTAKGGLDPKSPAGSAASFSKATKEALVLANTSMLLEFASEELLNSIFSKEPTRFRRQAFKTTRAVVFGGDGAVDDLFGNALQGLDVSAFVPREPDLPQCDSPEERLPCNPAYPFRTISGNCNNLRRPRMGRALTTFGRLLPPAYEDGVSRPRVTSVAGGPLPSPRQVSTMIHVDISDLHSRYSMMLMQFAQFTDHDLTFTPVHKGFFSSIPDCRSCSSARTVHPECMPIPVPDGDHYYPQFNHSSGERMCFPFMRSLPGQLTLGAREQINQNSAFLDLSQVYGEHACMARGLRAPGGRLNVSRGLTRGKDLLPRSPVHPECRAPSGYCFIAGDGRASEQPALTVMHTLSMREHNRLADGLRLVNPQWDEERVFQHARRVHTAMQQHVTYNEFLPRLLGWAAVNRYDLKLRPHGYYNGYNPQCNPSIVNEFAAAAYRIGHSLLRPHIPRLSASYQPVDPPILLRTGFFNPDALLQPGIVDEVTRGLASTPVENMDQFITGEVTNHLFEDKKIPHSGIDLISLNIQRGRDHGLRSYNDYRALCNLKRAETFDDLSREMSAETIARFKRIYASVEDIDLFPGGMSERPVQGGLVGPTFACIIGTQFRQLRRCDRFW